MTLSTFYRSPEWVALCSRIMLERVNASGDIICEHCGKPIVNKYDCIRHHKIPLTEANVNDYTISLNPDNIALVHHRCHNAIHNRFGSYTRHVYIVWGSPCAGKSTYVDSVALKDDLIIDIDRIYSAVNNARSNRLYDNVMQVYRTLIDAVQTRNGRWVNAFIVRTFPLKGERERLAASLVAELVHIDTPQDVCLERAFNRAEGYDRIVTEFWQKFQK
jgi:predicted kinase